MWFATRGHPMFMVGNRTRLARSRLPAPRPNSGICGHGLRSNQSGVLRQWATARFGGIPRERTEPRPSSRAPVTRPECGGRPQICSQSRRWRPGPHFQWKPPAALAIGDFQVDCLSIFAGKQRSDHPERVEPHICPEVPLSQWSELAMLTA